MPTISGGDRSSAARIIDFFDNRDDRFADRLRDDRFRERIHHGRRDSDLGWGGFDGGAYYDESPVAEAAPVQFFAGPSLDIRINIAPPASASAAKEARYYARPAGPRIITIGASSEASNLEKLPIVIYGRPPVGETD